MASGTAPIYFHQTFRSPNVGEEGSLDPALTQKLNSLTCEYVVMRACCHESVEIRLSLSRQKHGHFLILCPQSASTRENVGIERKDNDCNSQ